jgi:hypothetical protein
VLLDERKGQVLEAVLSPWRISKASFAQWQINSTSMPYKSHTMISGDLRPYRGKRLKCYQATVQLVGLQENDTWQALH